MNTWEFYQEKWRAIAFSTEPINRQKAKEAVKAAYEHIAISNKEGHASGKRGIDIIQMKKLPLF